MLRPDLSMSDTIPNSVVRVPISERIELGTLLALAFVLPLFEAPKNLLWMAFLAIWLANRFRARDFGGPWNRWDTLIVLWIASGYVAAFFAGIRGDEWSAAGDIVRYASVLWVLRRSRYPDRTWFALLAAIIAGTAVGLAWGFYGVVVTGEHRALGLHSVGHVSHSSLYLAAVFAVALAAVRAWWHEAGPLTRVANLGVLALMIVSLFWMQSRAAVGAASITALALLSIYAVRRGGNRVIIGLGALAVAGAVLVLNPKVVEKNTEFMQKDYLMNGRDEIWRVGVLAWREFPLFGVGMDNFGRIGFDQLESWSAKRDEAFHKESFLPASHGHSLYVNTLAERGLVGLAVLLTVLAAWAIALIRRIPDAGASPLLFAYWGSAAGAWLVTVLGGTLNTTLHHEQALLCMLLLGGWLSLASSGDRPT
jgi:O-antigen ligase